LIMLLFDKTARLWWSKNYCHLFYSSGNRSILVELKSPLKKHKTFILLYETKTSIRILTTLTDLVLPVKQIHWTTFLVANY
jgi:hypothetical protein